MTLLRLESLDTIDKNDEKLVNGGMVNPHVAVPQTVEYNRAHGKR